MNNKTAPIIEQPTAMDPNYGHQQLEMGQLGRPGGNIPPGLEYLAGLDSLFIKQDLEFIEIFLGCEMKNRYVIKSPRGEIMFRVKEETDCCTRQCCGPIRPFDMYIKDPQEQPVIHLSRPLNCDSCCCPCCLQVMQVYSPPGVLVGTIEQKWSLFPRFEIKDHTGQVVLKIEGPLCTCSCTCSNVDFNILSVDGVTQVGKISKQWSGLLKEAFTDADNFGINFPMDLSIQMKATLIGACFIIDFMYFEKTGNNS